MQDRLERWVGQGGVQYQDGPSGSQGDSSALCGPFPGSVDLDSGS